MKLKEIERLRAVAILMVMNLHWATLYPFLPEIAHGTWSGVDLFFVISGYVVTLSLLRLFPAVDDGASFLDAFERSRQALKVFYARRFFRIVPAALAGILIQRICIDYFPEQFNSRDEWRADAVAIFSGVFNYKIAYNPFTKLGVYWSLSVEEHFYLLLPLVFIVLRTTSRRLAACAFVAFACTFARRFSHPEVPHPDAYLKYASHLRFDTLMAGVAIALMAEARKGRSIPPPVMPRWLMRFVILPCCVGLVAMLPAAIPEDLALHEGFVGLWMISAVLVAYAGMDRGYVLSFPVVDRVLEYVGSRSYGLYLIHLTVSHLEEGIRHTWGEYDRWLPTTEDYALRRTALLFAVALCGAELIHRLIERPFIALGRRLTDPTVDRRVLAARAWQWAAAGLTVWTLITYRHRIALAFGPPNLARGKLVIASSHLDYKPPPSALTNGVLESEYGLHTKEEEEPWAEIDLGQPTRVGSIHVYNREDGFQDQQLPLEVSLSVDGSSYKVVALREKMFTQALYWRLNLTDKPLVRYIRLRVKKKTFLCLSEVEVYAGSGPRL